MKTRPLPAIGKLLLCISPALMQTALAVDIEEEVNQPLATSTVDGGSAGDINITADGSVVIEDSIYDRAVHIDSSNSLTNLGEISINDLDNVVGVRIDGNLTTSFSNTGDIRLVEDYTREDTDDDGDLDGPLALGTNKTALLLDNAGTMTGDISFNAGSSALIEGNSSAGIRLQSTLDGALTNDGVINLVGDDSFGIDIQQSVTGNVLQSGTVDVRGENSIGLRLADGISGSLVNEGTVVSSGFTSRGASNYADPDSIGEGDTPISERIDAEDLRDNGPAIRVGGSLGQGFLNNGNVDPFVDEEEAADETKDTVEDFDENRALGNITTFGSAPALQITPDAEGTDSGDIVIGTLVENVRDTTDDDEDDNRTEIVATFNYDYGLINRGNINSEGLNVGFGSTAVSIAGTAGGSRGVLIEGGIFNSGTIVANAFEADSLALGIGPYAETDQIINQGNIRATTTTDTNHQARAIFIDQNARVNAITNTSSIRARVTATDSGGVARAITDLSGTLTDIHNQGGIEASISYQDSAQPREGTAIAIDLSSHVVGQDVSILQTMPTPVDDLNDDGVVDENDVSEPLISGDILLGAGNDSLDIRAGLLRAEVVDLGAGNDQLLVSNGATVRAGLSGVESVRVEDAVLENLFAAPLELSQLEVLGDSELRLHLDTSETDLVAPRLNIAGNASIDASSDIYLEFEGALIEQLDLSLIDAGSLTFGDGTNQPGLNLPAIYQREVTLSGTSLDLGLTTEGTPEALGLGQNETAAFASVIEFAATDDEIGTAILSYEDATELKEAYDLLMPDYGDSVSRVLASELGLANGVTASRLQKIDRGDVGGWFDFSATAFDQELGAEGVGYEGAGTSLQFGLDAIIGEGVALGFSGGLRNGHGDPQKVLEHRVDWTGYDLSVYSSYQLGNWSLYGASTLGRLSAYSDRQVVLGGIEETYSADWGGYYASASSKLTYERAFGARFFVAPSLVLDYLTLSQDSYSERAQNGNELLALGVGEADASRGAATALLSVGRYNRALSASEEENPPLNRRRISQKLYLGYRSEFATSSYSTTAAFLADGTNSFRVENPYLEEDAVIFGADLSWSPEGTTVISLGYSGELAGDYSTNKLYLGLRIRW